MRGPPGRRSSRRARAAREALGGLGERLRQRRGEAAQVALNATVPRAGAWDLRCARRRANRAIRSRPRGPRSTACARSAPAPTPAGCPRHSPACAGCRSASTAVAIEASKRPPNARPVSAGASISRLRTQRPPADVGRLERLLPVAQRDCRRGCAMHRHDAPVEILDRQDHATSACTGPAPDQVGEHGAEGRREGRRLQHADRAACVDSAVAARGKDRFAQVATVHLRRRRSRCRRCGRGSPPRARPGHRTLKSRSNTLQLRPARREEEVDAPHVAVARNTPCPSRYGKPLVGPVIDTLAVVTWPARKAASSQRIAFGDSRPGLQVAPELRHVEALRGRADVEKRQFARAQHHAQLAARAAVAAVAECVVQPEPDAVSKRCHSTRPSPRLGPGSARATAGASRWSHRASQARRCRRRPGPRSRRRSR